MQNKTQIIRWQLLLLLMNTVTADDDDFGENFDLGSDDELEFNNYNE